MHWPSSRLLSLLLLLLPLPALAAQERLSVSQASDGSIVIALSGTRDCSGSPNPQAPTVSAVGSSISLVSVLGPTLTIVCTPPFDTISSPYSIAANVGHLADGNYTAMWSFAFSLLPPPVSTSFAIGGGVLGPIGAFAVPALSPWALLALAILVAGTACTHPRYARRKGPSP